MADNKLATIGPDMFSDTRLQLIRDTVARGAPETVFAAMIEIAKVRGLDPLAKQISVIQLGGTWQVLTTIDGYRALAEQSNAYAGQDEPIHEFSEAGHLISTTLTVYKIVQGMRVPFTAKVYAAEYNTGKSSWAKMPITMLTKVAESHALRKAFPSILSGLFTREEMDQADVTPARVDVTTGEIVDATPPHARFDARELRSGIVEQSKANEASRNDTPERRKNGLAAVFAAGQDRGLKQGEIKALCYWKFKVESMTELTADQLGVAWKWINETPPRDLKDQAEDLVEAAMEAEFAGVE